MRIARETEYAVRALIDLAEHYGQGPVRSTEIAARQDIPGPFLQQVLGTLRKAGLINTLRGRQGGHTLARQPDDIHLAEVWDALVGPPVAGIEPGETGDGPAAGLSSLEFVWQRAVEAMRDVLASTSIGDLMRRERERRDVEMYYI